MHSDPLNTVTLCIPITAGEHFKVGEEIEIAIGEQPNVKYVVSSITPDPNSQAQLLICLDAPAGAEDPA